MEDFFEELVYFYKNNRRKICRNLYFFGSDDMKTLRSFCCFHDGESFKYENLCKLSYIFLETTQKSLGENLHNRLALGQSNEYVKLYFEELKRIQSKKFYFSAVFRKSQFKNRTLNLNGHIGRVAFK